MSTDFEGMLDEVVAELNDRFHRGERPALEPYLERYPQLADPLRQQEGIDSSLPGHPTAAERPDERPATLSTISTSAAKSVSNVEKTSTVAAAADTSVPATRTPTISEGSTSRPYFQSVARLGIQAAQAIEHAHQMGIVHRDIKPSNLMVNAAGHLWVTDFGLAQIESAAELTMTGDLLGTLRYMSPEQAQGDHRVMGYRSDTYSLGATLYELLTLRPVVQERQRAQIFRAILESEPKPLRYWNRSIPRDLETIVLKCLRKLPADRYSTARELGDDLQRFLDDQPIRARRPTVFDRLGKWSRRHAAGLAATTVFVILLAASLTVVSMLWAKREHASRLAAEEAREAAELARGAAETERLRAESNLQMALQVMDSIYLRIAATQRDVSPSDESAEHSDEAEAAGKPDQGARSSGGLLHNLMNFYELLAQANQDSPSSFELVESTYRKVVGMREELAASLPEATGYYRALGARPSGRRPRLRP